MANVVATHAVGNMDTWLKGSDNRSGVFKQFCTGYRIYRHVDQNRVSVVFENADMAKMQAVLSSPETAAAKAQDTVIDPIDVYLEIEGGR
jgi:hypothetical protein